MNPETNGARTVAEVASEIEQRRREREAAARTFEVGGETFKHKPATTIEAMADYYDMASGFKSVSNHEAIEIIDTTMLAFLEPGQEEKWAKVRSDPKHPLSVGDCHLLIEALLEATTGRPTLPPSVSTDGQEAAGTTSTDVSLSKEETSAT